jgi:predicted nucleic acid-binding protein
MTNLAHPYLLDTNVIIGYMRKSVRDADRWVLRAFEGASIGISVITEFELWIGAQTQTQIRDTKIVTARFRRYPMIIPIARRAAELFRVYLKEPDRNRLLPDVLIAATAEHYRCSIVTTNVKHFARMPLRDVKIIGLTHVQP